MEAHRQKFKTRQTFDIPGHAHELNFTCYRNRPFLSNDRTCTLLAEAIEKARTLHEFDLWAYVFMPNHVHLLIWPTRETYSISAILQSIKQSVARRIMIHLREHEPDWLKQLQTGQKHTPYRFWQDGGGYDRNVQFSATLRDMVDYIHNNPVRKQLVETPADWEWSSAREWMEIGSGPISIDKNSFPIC